MRKEPQTLFIHTLSLHKHTHTHRLTLQGREVHIRFELDEGPVGRPIEVGYGEPVGPVVGQALAAAHHPVVVLMLLLFRDVLGRPGVVPR